MTTAAILDLRLPRLAPRTRLYHVPPIGIGTPLVEGLAGYMMRLAEAHSVTTSALVTDELLPLMKPRGLETRPAANWLADHGPHFNGTDVRAQLAVEALMLLTGRQDLAALTLLPWARAVAPYGLLRLRKPARVWCTACYADLLTRGEPIYEPLLWSIAVVSVCPQHRIRLNDHCPHAECGRPLPAIAAAARPGHCSWCRRPLYCQPRERVGDDGSTVEGSWDLWVAQQLGDLVAATAAPRVLSALRSGVPTLDAFIRARCGGGPGASGEFAGLADLHRNYICRWRKGHVLPTIDVLLRVCHHLDVSLVQFLTGETAGLTATTRPEPPARPQRRRPRTLSVPDTEQFRQNLEIALAETPSPPLSANAAARRLGCTSATLARLHPEAYRSAIERYRSWRTQQSEARVAQLAADIRRIMAQLDAADIYPAAKRVRPLLPYPIHPRNNQFNRLRHQFLLELGWSLGGTRLTAS